MLSFGAQVSLLLTGCVSNGRLDQMTVTSSAADNWDEETGLISDDDDDVWVDATRKCVMPASLGIART